MFLYPSSVVCRPSSVIAMNARPADRLAIAVAQLNPIVGDVPGNLERARKPRAPRPRATAPISSPFPSCFIAGYPPEDLVLKPAFQAACRAAVEALARDTADGGPAVLIGTPWVEDGKLYNAYALLSGGRIEAIRFKVNLPNYGVFDEKRVFASGPVPGPDKLPRRAARPAGLRGYLDRLGRLRERGRVPGRNRRRAVHRAQRLAVLARQDRRAAQRLRRARHRGGPAAHLRQPGRRPGRAGVRRRIVRAERRSLDRIAAAGVPRSGRDDAMVAQSAASGAARRGRSRRRRNSTKPITPPACWACAITSRRTASRASCSAFPAASIRRCARRWRPMRWAASACAA